LADWNQFQVGAVVQPLTTTSGNTLLRDADPSLFYALDFWQYVINTYPGPRLLQAATAARASGINVPIASAVAQVYPYEPSSEFLENQIQFPALFAYRTRAHSEQWTAAFDHDVVEVQVVYVLPPLDAAGYERILPIFPAVAQALRYKTMEAWDPGYTPPGGTLGAQFDEPAFANLQEIGFSGAINRRVVSTPTEFYRIGHLPGTGNIWFPALLLSAYWIEKDDWAPTIGGPSKFVGADITGNVKDADGTVVAATSTTVVQASTQLPPTITSLSVNTGPIAGGTSVTITGTLFLTGPPTVFFGPKQSPQYAASVTYTSSTSLTITTPAVNNAGIYDLTIANRDGQSVTSAGAFTFT
jgi:hypothetical protein